jgi:NADPH:quinone reductase
MSRVHIARSTIIEASADRVWLLLRDFNGHQTWHPAVATSRIEEAESGDVVGAVRAFTLEDGTFLREQLIALSDRERCLTYCLLEAPMPLIDYVATIQIRPVTDGDRTFVHWQSTFAPPPERAAELERLVAEDIYEAGFNALKLYFASRRVGAQA